LYHPKLHHNFRDEVTPKPTTSGEVSLGNKLGLVYPSVETAFKALLSARTCAAIWSNITDCDETFNYWEPVSSNI
jgi:alpha-1,2-mannosyltransferase